MYVFPREHVRRMHSKAVQSTQVNVGARFACRILLLIRLKRLLLSVGSARRTCLQP